MNNSGNPDGIVIRRPRLMLALGGAAVLLAIYIGTQVFGILYGIVFPASPPLPPGVHELRHESSDHGVDFWLYGSDMGVCDVLAFYQARAKSCVLAPGRCSAETTIEIHTPGQHIAICTGEDDSAAFPFVWEVNIATGDESSGSTQFSMSREMYWSGNLPLPTSTPGTQNP